MHEILTRYADFISEGFVHGRLYEVGGYPGLKLTSSEENRVYGELYRLRNREHLFDVLDDYEECSSRHPEPHEYRRVRTTVHLANGNELSAWVYEYNHSTETLDEIASGDYLERISKNCFP